MIVLIRQHHLALNPETVPRILSRSYWLNGFRTRRAVRPSIGSGTCQSQRFAEVQPPTRKMEDDFSDLNRPQIYLFGELSYCHGSKFCG